MPGLSSQQLLVELPDFHQPVVRAPSIEAAVTDEAARGYDLVFLGLDRPRALSHRLLRALLASGGSDVVLVRAPAGGAPPPRFERLLVPVTGVAPSRAAAELAVICARETQARGEALRAAAPEPSPEEAARAATGEGANPAP